MKIPLKYSARSLFARKLTMALTVLGIMLVAFVFAAVLMMTNGLEQAMIASGNDDNVIVIRQASASEINSFISRDQAGVIETLPEIARDESGKSLVVGELIVIINEKERASEKEGNVMVRGVEPLSMAVHKGVNITAGRMLEFGKTEIVIGKKTSEKYEGCGLGEILTFGMTDWTVVGIFEANGASFESEVWGDVNQLMPVFGRPVYSSMTFTMADPSVFDQMRDRVKGDPRMTVDMKPEKKYYEQQSSSLGTFISVLGTIISIVFSLGAIIGAMITMYAAVANRTTEIATMRALGFKRRSILTAFLIEAITISLIGGILGLVAATFLQSLSISTINWDTFSDLSFSFAMSEDIIITVMIFSLSMGILGGFLPAVRASRIKIVDALKAE
ncbi:MAG: ABC transporter permease [candidate division Zixibacteria bacterium]|nr:ABC transporter permease [candidate division Zixibacteria bacterium]